MINELGTGGVGVIYRVFDQRMDKEVALKVLNTHSVSDDIVMRFQREARSASQLAHPNLINIYDFGISSSNEPYMVMELVKGKTLNALLKRRGRFSQEETVAIVLQICSAMAHAHKNGVIHRDLKSSNIMLQDTADGAIFVKILDFGIAKLGRDNEQSLTHTGQVIGTARYMSPEQATGKPVDHRTDIYSIGCVMYELLTGKVPFRAETYMEVLTKHVEDPVPILNENCSFFEPEHKLDRILQRALAKSPEERFQSMNDFADALRALNAVAEENPDTRASATKGGTSKRVRIWLVAAVLLFIGLGTASASVYFSSQSVVSVEKLNARFVRSEFGFNWIVVPPDCTSAELESLKMLKGVTRLRSENRDFNDACLSAVSTLPLDVLNLSETKVTNDGLKIVRKIKTLKCLMLDYNRQIDDVGVERLRNHPALQVLSLAGTGVTDECAPAICSLRQLRALELRDCGSVTNRLIDHVVSMSELKMLSIGNTGITGDAMSKLGAFKNLRFLRVNNIGLTDADLDRIGARRLQALLMDSNPAITDAAVLRLERFTSLSFISVRHCPKVTLSALLTLLARTSCNSDNNFFRFLEPPKELARIHWNFYYDPVYFDTGYQGFVNRYGKWFGYGANLDVQRGWFNKLKGFMNDPKVSSTLTPTARAQLDALVQKYTQASTLFEIKDMYENTDLDR